ncbi:MAG TPA: hypothetical protein VFH33_07495 [Candidatus Krumholzibacteria bacterium]|nr:hypothetical protein [Candidatus Krumholzibacteria bacterium]
MKQPIRKISAFVVIVTMLLGIAAPVIAGEPAEDLKQIEYKYYFRGKYPEAISALTTFIARIDVKGDVAVRANEFLAASHVLSGAPQNGKDVFAKLIASDASYAGPDAAVFKPEVVDVYAQARADYAARNIKTPAVAATDSTAAPAGAAATDPAVANTASKPIYKKWWFYAGTAALMGVVAVATGGGGGGDEDASPRGTISVGVNVK